MLFNNVFVAALLAVGAVAVPDGKTIIGYRKVNKGEADAIKANGGRPVYDKDVNTNGKQIGGGVYTTPGPGEYNKGPADDWHCVIYAGTDALDRVSKIWVPNYLGWKRNRADTDWVVDTLLWYSIPNINRYIQNFDGNDWNPKRTLRMSKIQGSEQILQLLIPPELVDAAGALDVSAVCAPTVGELPDQTRVNYDDWQNNIGGNRDSPPKPTADDKKRRHAREFQA